MIISVSKSTRPEGWAHTKFDRVKITNLRQFAQIITTKHWAGIAWKDDYRKSDNFESCELCVLDFDDGKVTMDEFTQRMKELNYWFVIGPSKSHQKPKNGITCDRFRAVLRFSEPITDKEQYYQNMKRIQKCFFSDWQATGPHMKFAPCTSVYSYAVTPDMVRVKIHAKKIYPVYQTVEDLVTPATKSVPLWIPHMLNSADSGERNITVYKAARTLKKRSFSEVEAISIVEQSGVDISKKEIKNTVHSAYKR